MKGTIETIRNRLFGDPTADDAYVSVPPAVERYMGWVHDKVSTQITDERMATVYDQVTGVPAPLAEYVASVGDEVDRTITDHRVEVALGAVRLNVIDRVLQEANN